MKSSKKVFICTIALGLSLFFIPSATPQDESLITYNKGVQYIATYAIPSDLTELETSSEVIVKGKYCGDRVTDNDSTLVGPASISQFEVIEVQKGEVESSQISIIEPFKIEGDNFINVDGYVPMKEECEYILFLRKVASSDNEYTLVSANFGKYNLSNDTALLPEVNVINNLGQVSNLDMVTQSAEKCEIYNKIKSEITNEIYEQSNIDPGILQNADAFYNFRIEQSGDIPYYMDYASINVFENHQAVYENAIEQYNKINSSNIALNQVNETSSALIEFYSIYSSKEQWLGISKLNYSSGSDNDKVTKARVYLNEYNLKAYKLTDEHVDEVALHELGHCFGLMHQDKSYATQTIMAPYLSTNNAARTTIPEVDQNNLRYAYPGQKSVETTSDYSDHWAKEQISDFVEKGYISGYPDGTFLPNNPMTRAEFVTVLNKVFSLTNSSGVVFNDTNNHWAKDAIDIAVTNGICNGVSDTEFMPNAYITREQAATMISNYKKLTSTNQTSFEDYLDISSWATVSVENVVEAGYMTGYPDNTFKPKDNISRAEAVVTLSRIK